MTMPYDEFAITVDGDYKMFLNAIAGVYRSNVATGVAVTPASIMEVTRQTKELAAIFTLRVQRETEEYAQSTNSHAQAVGLSTSINAAVGENIAQIIRLMKTGVGNYKDMMRGAHGAIGLLLQKKLSTVEFKLYDSLDRKWDAEKLFHTTARDYAYQAWVNQRALELVDQGFKLAYAVRDSSSSNNSERGLLFSIGEPVDGYKTLAEVRKLVFHVNSSARLVGYVPS
jgi:hypothetical protein